MRCCPPSRTRRKSWTPEGYYIFEAIDEDGEQQLAEVEDEELINRLAAEFERRFDEMFEEGEDSEE